MTASLKLQKEILIFLNMSPLFIYLDVRMIHTHCTRSLGTGPVNNLNSHNMVAFLSLGAEEFFLMTHRLILLL